MKKKNNPFKMVGSYIGAILGWASLYPILGGSSFGGTFPQMVTYVIFLFIGFLLGWGLTLLWRKFK